MYSQIINPYTNKSVDINSKLGRHILSNYIENYQSGGAALVALGRDGVVGALSGALSLVGITDLAAYLRRDPVVPPPPEGKNRVPAPVAGRELRQRSAIEMEAADDVIITDIDFTKKLLEINRIIEDIEQLPVFVDNLGPGGGASLTDEFVASEYFDTYLTYKPKQLIFEVMASHFEKDTTNLVTYMTMNPRADGGRFTTVIKGHDDSGRDLDLLLKW